MNYLDYQLEILRGQIEELQGKLEELFALRRGQSGMFGSLRGRSRRMRGRARQSYARARYGVLGMRSRLHLPGSQPEPPPDTTRYVLLAVGLSLVLAALVWPGIFTQVWNEINGRVRQYTDPTNAAQTSAEL
jgi:hypothetical protein